MKTRNLAALALAGLLSSPLWAADVPPVSQPGVCYGCHVEFEDLAKQPHVHTAFTAGKCSACHNPHASQHAILLNDKPSELCLPCHEGVRNEVERTTVHPPAATGQCLSCHDPHASKYANQLVAGGSELCKTCHESIETWEKRKIVHAPFASDECMSCHAPHGSDASSLMAERVPDLCFTCHDQDNAFTKAHKGYKLDNANCVTCHDPHSSDKANLIMPNEHRPFEAGSCKACHVFGGETPFALTSDINATCTKCHASIRAAGEMTYSAHLADQRSCMNCHNAHASSGGNLLSAATPIVCMKCHAQSEKWAGKSRESLLTHQGMDCATCHTPHGSDNPQYLKDTGSDLCLGCHADAHTGAHPIGPEVIDPRTGKQVTCQSCHQLHGADYDPYLPLSPEMDLCIQCHRK